MNRQKHILILSNVIIPQRIPLYNALNEYFKVKVLYCHLKKEHRLFSVDWDAMKHSVQILKSVRIRSLLLPNVFDLLRITEKKFDVFIFQDIGIDNILVIIFLFLYCKIKGKSVIMARDFWPVPYYIRTRKFKYRILNSFTKLLVEHLDAFIAMNKRTHNQVIEERWISPDKVFLCPQIWNPQNECKILHQIRKKRMNEIKKEIKTIVTLCYLHRFKGIDILLKACSSLSFPVNLIIIGDGPDFSRIEKMSRELNNLNKDLDITLTGYKSGCEKYKLLSKGNLFVLPSLYDTWGYVINEAIAMGLPVITTDSVPSGDYLVDGNGFIVPSADVKSLRKAIIKSLRNEKVLNKMSESSIRLYNKFNNINIILNKWKAAIDFVDNDK